MSKKEYIKQTMALGFTREEAETNWELDQAIPKELDIEDDDDFDLEDVSDRYGD
jgi:hypothetical protein